MSGILALGLILSVYGNHVLFEDLVNGQGDIKIGENLIIPAELKRSDSVGIYAIQIDDYDGESVSVHILNPSDIEIASDLVNDELFESTFPIDSDGVYKLVAKNDRTSQVKIFGVIGPEPDAGTKSLGFVSLYVLIIGLLGMVGVGIFAIKNRKKS